jgi:hypothetical protein
MAIASPRPSVHRRGSRRASLAVLTIAVVTTLSWITTPAGTAHADTVGRYAALGDSYAAGLGLVPSADPNTFPAACGQSTINYPHRIQQQLHYSSLQDVSCAGATMLELFQPQHDVKYNGPLPDAGHPCTPSTPAPPQYNPPQLCALSTTATDFRLPTPR